MLQERALQNQGRSRLKIFLGLYGLKESLRTIVKAYLEDKASVPSIVSLQNQFVINVTVQL